MRVLTASQMKQVEHSSLQYGLTFHRLMENAGAAAAAFIRRTFKIAQRNCIVFCARGNNGGDGLVVARKLAENDVNVLIILVDGPPVGEEAASMFASVELMGLPVLELAGNEERIAGYLRQADLVVDAICGTGFSGELRESHKTACELINRSAAAVVSLDLPTGVECDSGRVADSALTADFTIAFDSLKPAHTLPSSLPHCGQIETVDIGIPDEARECLPCASGAITTEQVFAAIPPRPQDSHKGTFGRLVNIAGSTAYRGAAVLSTLAAMRCGVGLVTLASVEPVCAATAARAPEAVLLPLAHNDVGTVDGTLPLSALTECIERANAVTFGCGLGNNLHTVRLLDHVIKNTACPLVLDADGINALAGNIHVLAEAKAPVVLTPHPGEMARLCGASVENVQRDRVGTASSFAERHNVVVVLKGAGTVIASPGEGVRLGGDGNSGLAKAGSGDVLTGMLGALLAQGLAPQTAAMCAVHLHELAADRAARRLSRTAMLPGDLLEELPAVFLEQDR